MFLSLILLCADLELKCQDISSTEDLFQACFIMGVSVLVCSNVLEEFSQSALRFLLVHIMWLLCRGYTGILGSCSADCGF